VRRAGAALAVLAVAAACGDDGRLRRPLLDSRYAPDVLVEAGRLAPRPTLDGNRFVAGWRPRRGGLGGGGQLALSAASAGARLEIVQLAPRARTLALDLEDGTFDADGRVKVRAAGRDLGAVAVADPLEIPLPPDLPAGRVLVELRPAGTRLVVREGRVRPALAAGEAVEDDGGLAQSGDSRVDVVLRAAAGESLAGRFAPPSPARAQQRFELRLERADGHTAEPFTWTPSLLGRLRGARRFEVPLGGAGLVRVSLVARGEGPPARWSDLFVVSATAASRGREPPAPTWAEPPELVLLYVMDALRADAVGHLGGGGATPTWDRLAREGLTFRAHRSVAPNTLPSTKALLTGEAYADRGGWKLAEGVATLAEAYRRAGYRTALFSGNPWVGPSYGVDRGFEHVAEVALDEHRAPYNDNAERLHEAALAWLASLPHGARAFVYVHAMHPHNPYAAPEPWRSDFTAGVGGSTVNGSTATLLALSRRRLDLTAADREHLRRLYAAGLAYADAHLGRFLEALEERVPRRSLLVALTSDHGEELFDHGGVLHGYTLYEEMIRIPLVLWWPGAVTPGEHAGPTSTLDLHATLAGLVAPDAAGEGRSLLPRPPEPDLHLPDLHLAAAASVKGGIYSVQSARWKLVWAPRRGLDWGLGGGAGRTRSAEYLFDLEADPRELANRAGEGGLEAAWLRSRLRAWIAAKTSRQTREEEPGVDDETRRRLQALGYVE